MLAVACRAADGLPADPGQAERDLTLLGLVGLEDPPRDDVSDAIAACQRAGIRLAMVTGDHPATARAVAGQVGLAGPDALVTTGGWRGNPLLLGAVAAEIAALFLFIGLPPLARLLGGGFPPTLGWLLATAAIPAVLLADAAHKGTRARRQPARSGHRSRARG